ncbi:hypothetical protein [Kitasatospora sp. NPDC004289]
MEPARYDTLAQAVESLSNLLADLPAADERVDAYRFFLADPARPADYLDRDGQLILPFTVNGRVYKATLAKA